MIKAALHAFRVRYEDLVDDPAAVVNGLKRQFFFADPQDSGSDGRGFVNVIEGTKTKRRDYSTYREYYREEQWKSM